MPANILRDEAILVKKIIRQKFNPPPGGRAPPRWWGRRREGGGRPERRGAERRGAGRLLPDVGILLRGRAVGSAPDELELLVGHEGGRDWGVGLRDNFWTPAFGLLIAPPPSGRTSRAFLSVFRPPSAARLATSRRTPDRAASTGGATRGQSKTKAAPGKIKPPPPAPASGETALFFRPDIFAQATGPICPERNALLNFWQWRSLPSSTSVARTAALRSRFSGSVMALSRPA